MKVWYKFEISEELAKSLTEKHGKGGDVRVQMELLVREAANKAINELLLRSVEPAAAQETATVKKKVVTYGDLAAMAGPSKNWLQSLGATA